MTPGGVYTVNCMLYIHTLKKVDIRCKMQNANG